MRQYPYVDALNKFAYGKPRFGIYKFVTRHRFGPRHLELVENYQGIPRRFYDGGSKLLYSFILPMHVNQIVMLLKAFGKYTSFQLILT